MLDLNNFVDKAEKLYTLPDLCLQLNYLVNNSTSSVDEISRLVSIDPALTFRVLRLANSALYVSKKPAVTVADAVQLIGTDELNNIAIATSAAVIFKGAGDQKIDLHEYWHHSVLTAILAKAIYKKSRGKTNGAMFVAGLLHNIGLLVVLERLPYFMVDLEQVIGDKRLALEHERTILGFSYSELGGEMIARWNISPMLAQVIRCQCSPFSGESFVFESVVLNIAIKISDNVLKPSGVNESEHYVESSLLEVLNLSHEQLDHLTCSAKDVAPSVAAIFGE